MATVNFSVPDDVKKAFDRAFGKGNKSAVVARLMRRAIEEADRDQRRAKLFRLLTEQRAKRPSASQREIRRARATIRS